MRRLFIILSLIVAAIWLWPSPRVIPRSPGMLIAKVPEQLLIETSQPPIKLKGWTLKPLAHYIIEARVLSTEHYSGDVSADLAPYDVAVGWQKMSDTSVIEKLDITQGGRFYHWRYWGRPPIPEHDIISQSANMHLIPADDGVLRKIQSLARGSLVRMSGLLVEASHPQGNRHWRSSLSREDSGDGACELMYVRAVTDLAASHGR